MQPQQAPDYAASPLGSFPEISQMYATSFSSPLSDAKFSSQAQADQVSVENAKKAQAEADARAKAFSDAKNYTVVKRPDGGYGFYAPDGKEVTAAQYAQVAGTTPDKVLADSENPIDQQYINDYQNFKAYGQAAATGDAATLKKFYDKNPKLKGIPPTDFRTKFQQAYPTVYGQGGFNGPGSAGQTYGSQYFPNIDKKGGNSILDKYGINLQSGQ